MFLFDQINESESESGDRGGDQGGDYALIMMVIMVVIIMVTMVVIRTGGPRDPTGNNIFGLRYLVTIKTGLDW